MISMREYREILDMYSDWVEGKILTKGNDRIFENTLGLVGEAGEVAEKVKKMLRDKARYSNEELLKELGDVLFYTTALANLYGGTLKSIIELNMEKLDGLLDAATELLNPIYTPRS